MKISFTKMSGIALILFGLGGAISGKIDYETGIQNFLVGIAIIRGRKAIEDFGSRR